MINNKKRSQWVYTTTTGIGAATILLVEASEKQFVKLRKTDRSATLITATSSTAGNQHMRRVVCNNIRDIGMRQRNVRNMFVWVFRNIRFPRFSEVISCETEACLAVKKRFMHRRFRFRSAFQQIAPRKELHQSLESMGFKTRHAILGLRRLSAFGQLEKQWAKLGVQQIHGRPTSRSQRSEPFLLGLQKCLLRKPNSRIRFEFRKSANGGALWRTNSDRLSVLHDETTEKAALIQTQQERRTVNLCIWTWAEASRQFLLTQTALGEFLGKRYMGIIGNRYRFSSAVQFRNFVCLVEHDVRSQPICPNIWLVHHENPCRTLN